MLTCVFSACCVFVTIVCNVDKQGFKVSFIDNFNEMIGFICLKQREIIIPLYQNKN